MPTIASPPTPGRVLDLIEIQRWVKDGTARKIRERSKVPRTALAAELGVHATTIVRWETGERIPRGELALAYRRLLVTLNRAAA